MMETVKGGERRTLAYSLRWFLSLAVTSSASSGKGIGMVRITDDIAIDEREIEESFIRAAGPGGQNVNKLASAVQLRFNVRHSASLPAQVQVRLERLAGRRLTQEGVLIITARRHRTQERNRQDALERLVDLIRRAALPPTPRRPTKPTAGAKRRRLQAKKQRAAVKRLRSEPPVE
jgi:ribosome-associated protein